jgi:hypothetical protein
MRVIEKPFAAPPGRHGKTPRATQHIRAYGGGEFLAGASGEIALPG